MSWKLREKSSCPAPFSSCPSFLMLLQRIETHSLIGQDLAVLCDREDTKDRDQCFLQEIELIQSPSCFVVVVKDDDDDEDVVARNERYNE